jgi:predicted  nucleic acid-binding Zn-ribbon protein
MKTKEEIEEEIFHIIDTQCTECGHLYAMLDYETESECPKCGHKDFYEYPSDIH